MKRLLKWVGGVTLATMLAGVAAAGIFLFPSQTASTGFSGAETVPMDTNLSGGRPPQTIIATLDQIKEYIFGNYGTAGVTQPTLATATSNAATCNASRCVVTTEALTTAGAANYNVNIANSFALVSSMVLATLANGTNTVSGFFLQSATPSAGSVLVSIRNSSTASALNGTLKIQLLLLQ